MQLMSQDILGYFGDIFGIFLEYFWDILGIFWGYFGDILEIFWRYFGDILGIFWGQIINIYLIYNIKRKFINDTKL